MQVYTCNWQLTQPVVDEFGVWSLEFGVWSLEFGVGRWALGVGRWALGVGRWALGVGRWALGGCGSEMTEPQTANCKP
jgi:hypothetical protein